VAIGVLPEYRSTQFVRRTGRRISHELIRHAARWFRDRGLERMRLIVDADNVQTILFYHGLGAKLSQLTYGGVASYMVSLDTGDVL